MEPLPKAHLACLHPSIVGVAVGVEHRAKTEESELRILLTSFSTDFPSHLYLIVRCVTRSPSYFLIDLKFYVGVREMAWWR